MILFMSAGVFNCLESISRADFMYLIGVSVAKRKHGAEQVLIFWYYM